MSVAALRVDDERVGTRPSISTRTAIMDDLAAVVELERGAWPVGRGMRADDGRLRRRIDLGGLLLAEDSTSGRVLGMISTFRPAWARPAVFDELVTRCPDALLDLPAAILWHGLVERYGLPRTWHEATGDGRLEGALRRWRRGRVVFGVGIATAPDVRGRGVASRLIRAALDRARCDGATYFVAYGRLPGFHRRPHVRVDTYLDRPAFAASEKAPYDIGLRLHWSAGAQPLRARSGRTRFAAIPDAMPGDHESRGFGCLIVNPLQAEDTGRYSLSRNAAQ